jgi:hypothetical protein
MNLKAIFAVKKLCNVWEVFPSLSLKTKGPQTTFSSIINVLNYQRHFSMSVSDREASKGDEM